LVVFELAYEEMTEEENFDICTVIITKARKKMLEQIKFSLG